MNRLPALLAASLLAGCGKSPTASPSEQVVDQAVGRYACRAYYRYWNMGTHVDRTTRLRDTVLLVAKVDAGTIRAAGQQLVFLTDSRALGSVRYPQYPYLFAAGTDYLPTAKYAQLAGDNDSLYYENRQNGHSLGQEWRYYGKKQP